MRIPVLTLVVAVSACSYTTRDTELGLANASPWKAAESSTNLTLATPCGDSDVIVSINKLISSGGKTYSFLLVPIGSADAFDKPKEGLDVFVRYPVKRFSCNTDDLSLVSDGVSVSPLKALDATARHATCSYHFDPTQQTSGNVVVQFHISEFCVIPELEIKFTTETKHHYDSIQG